MNHSPMRHGFLVVDKPVGMTSHDVVDSVRRSLGIRSVGHTGTLDPFASGVLVIALGAATKLIRFLDEERKTYHAVARLGEKTDTGDHTGSVLLRRPTDSIGLREITSVARTFIGDTTQIPHMYSALKHQGMRLYDLARRGIEIDRSPRPVTIHDLSIVSYDPPLLTFVVDCSRGTYVRTLAEDIGERLSCGAHLVSLRRLASGVFVIARACAPDELSRMDLASHRSFVGVDEALSHIPLLAVPEHLVGRVLDGLFPERLLSPDLPDGTVRLVDPQGGLIAMAVVEETVEGGRRGKLLRVFREFSALQAESPVV